MLGTRTGLKNQEKFCSTPRLKNYKKVWLIDRKILKNEGCLKTFAQRVHKKTVLTIQSSDHIRAMLEPDYKSCICIYYC